MSTSTEELRRGGIATSQVEYQMRFRDIVTRAAADARRHERELGPYLTISREAGSGGERVARLVGEKIGWSVLDKELVELLAADLKLEPRLLELMDETRANWFSETLLNLFNTRLVVQQGYVELLGKVVALAASAEPVVIVGRGAHLILPGERGLRVRIIAPRSQRLERLAQAEGLAVSAADDRLDEIDADRQKFVRRNLRRDLSDPADFDLVVNTGVFGIDGSVEVIVRALGVRGFV